MANRDNIIFCAAPKLPYTYDSRLQSTIDNTQLYMCVRARRLFLTQITLQITRDGVITTQPNVPQTLRAAPPNNLPPLIAVYWTSPVLLGQHGRVYYLETQGISLANARSIMTVRIVRPQRAEFGEERSANSVQVRRQL